MAQGGRRAGAGDDSGSRRRAASNAPGGTLSVTDSTFAGNQAQLGAGVEGIGGAIENEGNATVTGSTFDANLAFGGPTLRGIGGAISDELGGNLTVVDSTFTANQAVNDFGGAAAGGAIQTVNGGALSITGSTFRGNQAMDILNYSLGGAIYSFQTPLNVVDSSFVGNLAIGGPRAVSGPGVPSKNRMARPRSAIAYSPTTRPSPARREAPPLPVPSWRAGRSRGVRRRRA